MKRAQRAKSDAVVDLKDNTGNFTPSNARLVDISTSGACIASTLKFMKGQNISGRIHSPKQGPTKMTGHVVWIKPRIGFTLYGVAFDQATRLPL